MMWVGGEPLVPEPPPQAPRYVVRDVPLCPVCTGLVRRDLNDPNEGRPHGPWRCDLHGVVAPMWEQLEPVWGSARDVRPRQPVMATSTPSPVPADPGVRLVRPDELDILLPACVAMFTEEVGVSPTAVDGGAAYRARVAELIRARRSFARIEDGRVVFKAEIGAASPTACQVQGVWVAPELRGRGLSVGGMAAVLDLSLREVAPTVSLYVNDFNTAARAAYRRVGFRDVGTFMSVLF